MNKAKQIAKDFPENTHSIAECWAFFTASFATPNQGIDQSSGCVIL